MKTRKNTIEKVVVNTSFGKLSTNTPDFEGKLLPEIEQQFAAVVGQRGARRPARASISGFKLRQGMIIALKATLRGRRAAQFLERTITVALPRVRDFHGIKRSGIDEGGNLTFGIKEHIVFPEILLEKVRAPFGMEITIVPNQPMSKDQAFDFYASLGIPFEKQVAQKKK